MKPTPLHTTTVPTEILKQVRTIEIRARKLANTLFSGQYSSVFKGRGMVFSQVREYEPGDDPKFIDWNVSARSANLYSKEFMEEREQTVMIAIDASNSLFFGSKKNLKSEIAAEIAALLSFSAIRNNDKVGLVIFTDQIEKFIPPRRGQKAILRLIREILSFQPKRNQTKLNTGLEFLGRILKRKTICFLISDFLTPYNYDSALRIVAKKHDFTAIRISDPLEKQIPVQGRFLIRDLETGTVSTVHIKNNTDQQTLLKQLEKKQTQWEQQLARYHIDTIELKTGEPYALAVLQFFKKRSKRMQ